MSDFNTTVLTWVFPSGLVNPDIDTPIQITDDDKDEAIQVFIAFLEVIDAVNFDLLTVTRAVSICRIVDDDRKWLTIYYYNIHIFIIQLLGLGSCIVAIHFLSLNSIL